MRARVLILAAVVGACGGDDPKNYGDPLTSAQAGAQARTALESVTSLRTLETDPGSTTALAKVSGLYGAMSAVLGAKLAEHPPKSKAFAPALGSLAEALKTLGAPSQKPADGCFTVATGRITYANCSYGAGTINGSVAYAGGTFTSDLSIKYASGGTTFDVRQTGALSLATDAVGGDLNIVASSTIGEISVDYEISADFGVTLAAGCASAGQLEVHGQWEVKTGQGRGDYDVWAKAVFGPTCNDVKVY